MNQKEFKDSPFRGKRWGRDMKNPNTGYIIGFMYTQVRLKHLNELGFAGVECTADMIYKPRAHKARQDQLVKTIQL